MQQHSIDIFHKGLQLKIATHILKRGSNWLLLLHGIQSNKSLFDPWFEDPSFKDYSLMACDFIGFGGSSKPKEFSYSLEDQASVVLGIIDAMNIFSVVIVGHSLGGMVGTLLVEMASHKIKALVSLEGSFTLTDCGLSKDLADMSEDEVEKKVRLIINQLKSESKLWASRIQALETAPAFVMKRTSMSIVQLAKSEELLDMFSKASLPRQLIVGANSHFTSRPLGKNLKITSIPQSGHFLLLEQPQQTTIAIVNFLKEIK